MKYVSSNNAIKLQVDHNSSNENLDEGRLADRYSDAWASLITGFIWLLFAAE